MDRKKNSTKGKIADAAWELFMDKGYENTTINQIIETSGTSRGAFYHHFRGKEDLLFCLAYFFDQDYEEWVEKPADINILDRLLQFDAFVLKNLEESSYRPFLKTLYGLQVMTDGTRHIINPNRQYYKLVSGLMKEGLEKGEIVSDLSYMDLTTWYAALERGFTYDWLLTEGQYSLVHYGQRMMKIFLDSLKPSK